MAFRGCVKCSSVPVRHSHHFQQQQSCQCELKPWKCKFKGCEFRTRHKFTLKGHVLAKHTPGRKPGFRCSMCPASFYTKASLDLHIRSHVREESYRCNYCKFETHSRGSFVSHIRHVHKVSSVTLECTASGCDFHTTSKTGLKKHFRTHDPDPPVFPCTFPTCAHRASTVGNLRRHVNMRHNSPGNKKLFCCPLCSKLFSYKETLAGHIESVHTKENYYACDKCPYSTHRRSSIQQHHRKVHLRKGQAPEKNVKCESCEFRARDGYQLRTHTSSVHNMTKKLACSHPGCDFKTNYPQTLQRHMYTHEEDPDRQFPFACIFPGCGFRSRKKSTISCHERRHESCGKGKVKCKLCPQKFYPDRPSLLFHMRTSHDKTFVCKMCDFGAYSWEGLTAHVRKHHISDSTVLEAASERLMLTTADSHKLAVVVLEKIHLEIK